MEKVKPREEFLKPDPRWGDHFANATLDGLYELAGRLTLHNGIPEEVHSYFKSAVTLWLYGYLYYPFLAMAASHGHMAVELALKKRFPEKIGLTLRPLLDHAFKEGLLSDENYPSLPARRKSAGQFAEAAALPAPEAKQYARMVTETMPELRNTPAHPKLHSILPPGMAYDELAKARETINQLWPRPRRSAAP